MSVSGARLRRTHHHGDLPRTLLEVGVELARQGGPDAVVLREATRRAGVAPNAAYRHFADRQALLAAVSAAAQSRLAVAIEDAIEDAQETRDGGRAQAAQARLRGVGAGYLRFAREEPGLFRTAFSVPENLDDSDAPERAGPGGLTPFQLLSAALDDLVDAEVLPADRRPGAEFLAWSSVHGLATLLIDGPLRGLAPEQTAGVESRLLDMVRDGL